MLGSYAKTAACDTFLATAGEHHPTDLAALQGARLVTAIETEDDRRWAESKVKALTGGDRISARFMRQDFFEFTPQFKLLIAGNHKPSLRSTSEAIRRRFHLVPFTVTIPVAERDLLLGEKLRGEWPGILSWAIAGCLAWQREGLNPPKSVQDATAEYMAEEDSLGQFVAEQCATGDAKDFVQSSKLYAAYVKWCTDRNEKPLKLREFSPEIERRGFPKEHSMMGNVFGRIKLRESVL